MLEMPNLCDALMNKDRGYTKGEDYVIFIDGSKCNAPSLSVSDISNNESTLFSD